MEKNITKKLCSILLSFAIVLTSVCIPSVSVSAETSTLGKIYIYTPAGKWNTMSKYKWNTDDERVFTDDSNTHSANTFVKVNSGDTKTFDIYSKGNNDFTVTFKVNVINADGTVKSTIQESTNDLKDDYVGQTDWSAITSPTKTYSWTASRNYIVSGWSVSWKKGANDEPSIEININAFIPVEKITINGDSTLSLEATKSSQLSTTIEPSDATYTSVKWSIVNSGKSENETKAIASVDENGKVTGSYPGYATVTVTPDYGWTEDVKDYKPVHVDYYSVDSFDINAAGTKSEDSTIYLNPNYEAKDATAGTVTYESSVDPNNATWGSVDWTLSDASVEGVATIKTNEDGTSTVTASKPGTVKINGTTGYKDIDETHKLDNQTKSGTVTVKVHPSSVEFVDNKGEDTESEKTNLDIYEGETIDLAQYIKVLGYTTKDGEYYNASNEKVTLSYETAKIDGGAVKFEDTKVTGVTDGKGTITVKTEDGNKTATLNFIVNKPVNGVTLKIDGDVNKVLWYNGSEAEKTLDIAATLLPQGYYLKYKNIEWSIDSYKDVNGDSLSTDIVSIAKKETTLADGTTKVDDKTAVLTLKEGAKAGNITVKITINNETDRGQSGGDENEPVTATIDIKVQGYVEKLLLPESAEIYKNCTESDHTIDLSEKNGVLDFYVRDAYNKEVTWKSSDESVATVDENGVVTAVGYGTAKITATSVGLNKDGKTVTSNECEVHVQLHPEDVAETKITGTKNPNTNLAGQVYYNSNADTDRSTTLTVNLSPENAKYKNIVWDIDETDTKGSNYVTVTQDSQDKTLATVTVKGEESGVAQIRATITYEESGVEKTIVREYTIEVLGLVDSITSADGKKDITIYNNAKSEELAKATLEAVVNPEDAYLTTIDTTYGQNGGFYIWKASGSTASISLTNDKENVNKATIKALTPGKLEVMVASAGVTTTHSKHQLYTWNVNVVELVEGIELNKATTSIQEGSNETLVATIKNETASDKSVTWTSSDPSIATVDASGKVVAKKTGTVTITATANDKYDPDGTIGGYNKVATCKVTVTAKPAETKVVTCEEANGKGWVWSEAKKACVYKVTNTSAE